MLDEGKARKQPVSDSYIATHERIYGWECFYCEVRTKETHCPKCKRPKEEVKR